MTGVGACKEGLADISSLKERPWQKTKALRGTNQGTQTEREANNKGVLLQATPGTGGYLPIDLVADHGMVCLEERIRSFVAP